MGCQQEHADHQTCTECEFDPFVRNHFFTGKMMGAGEFDTESHYHAEKLRHHNLRLHGWGVVCGLRVRQHPSPDCRMRYLLIDPGSALDCCGREILVTRQEFLDVGQHPAVKQKTGDGLLHTLQVALCHRECPTEDVPVLYDECGCDDTRCAPNRILESFAYDVLVDPPLQEGIGTVAAAGAFVTTDLHGVTGTMRATAEGKVALVDPGDARRALVLDPARRRLLAVNLPAAARALALAPDGVRFFVVTDPIAGPECEVHVYLTADGAEVAPLSVPARTIPGTTTGSSFAIACGVPAARRLLVLDRSAGKQFSWAEDAGAGIEDAPATTTLSISPGSQALAVSDDGAFGFTIDPSGLVQVSDLAAGTTTALTGLPPSAKPNALAAFVRGADAMLAVASGDERRLYLVNRSAGTLATVALAHPPQFLHAGSSAAPWITIYEEQASHAYVQSVSLAALPPLVGAPRAAGSAARRIVLLQAGGQAGMLDPAMLAGGDCADLLHRQMANCAGCDTPECVVLATLANYRPGSPMQDLPAKGDDLDKQVVRIDNRSGRRELASTATLQAWIECLESHSGAGRDGKDGLPGSPGTPGADGLGLDPGLPKIIDIGWEHGAQVDLDVISELYTGLGGSEDVASRIVEGGNPEKPRPIFTLYFNKSVNVPDAQWWRQVFKLSVQAPMALRQQEGTYVCAGIYWPALQLYGDILVIDAPPTQPILTPHTNEEAKCAIAFVPRPEFFRIGSTRGPGFQYILRHGTEARLVEDGPLDQATLHIAFASGFVAEVGPDGKLLQVVVDGENVGGRVGLDEARAGIDMGGKNPSGNLALGGTFESWITIAAPRGFDHTDLGHWREAGVGAAGGGAALDDSAPPPSINLITAEQLHALPSIDRALVARVLAERERASFAGVDDLRQRLELDEGETRVLTDNLLIA